MSDAFDPYYEWLGIQPQEQPVNYYRLLGLNLYETNLQVIANAADRQMSYIRTFQIGAHAQESQAILNEIAKARVTLLNEMRKREYDNNLKGQVFRGEVRSEAPPVSDTPPVSATPPFLDTSPFSDTPPFLDTLPVSDTPSVPGTPSFSPANGFAPVQPPVAGSRNSMPPKSGEVSDSQQLRLKAEIQRLEAEEKAKRSLILKIGAVGSCFLVLLMILVLIMSFSRSPSTPVSPSGHEEGLADTNQKTTQAIEKPPLRAGDRMVKTVKGVEFAFRWCPPGTFMMGSPKDEEGRWDSEKQHKVTLSKGFWMLETEVTQRQWQAIMGNNLSLFKGDNLPVEQVSWDDCQEFCKKFNSESGLQIGLPTESQWEYACRAGTTEAYAGDLDSMGWRWNNSGGKPHPVGTKQPNAWGLYDMHGNVSEWCSDWKGDYPGGSVTDPTGASSGSYRVIRGGSCYYSARYCRSAYRSYSSPGSRINYLGFRPVFVLFVP